MTPELTHDAARPVNDRYTPSPCGELDEIAEVLAEGRLSGGAPVLPRYEQALADWFGVKRAVAVNSGSSALHATLVALGVRAGDQVLVPATAPLPTAMPILTCGATPVIVDTAPGSLAMDPDAVAARLTPRVRAAISLPLWGYPADDTPAAAILAAAGVPVIEDACQAHGTRSRGRYAGTNHRAGCFSTHDRKLLSTGEGGFVLTDDDNLADRIDHYTHLGHLTGRTHGVNYKLAGPLAAIGLRRLPGLHGQLRTRRANAHQLLAALPVGGHLTELGHGDAQDEPNYYNLVLTTSAAHLAPRLSEAFARAGLAPDSTRYGYRPLYHQQIFAPYATACPHAEHLAATTFQLPVHPDMSPTTLGWVADRVRVLAEGQLP
ncbi:DegT/DnrJ/EryC1/StrS family aminotransferase [Solwaraspora sp. WMMD1047]|uniref:DegT/DnrJ/EryC1/StrS family aminotransferase n=1 Tax=Solwaraspora sp. WMMD1047 TaxID=3016102 RepID=UPI00241738AA|nr:DegT/DnrJ/EryC1/StrS family aminotransferase [Solwaraspora sp. WMMD1047]MDG4833782.1 DegT/DnrJ/EryC1/StrS family aminotransferase [Solwaraspora sp. WMMD1047]